MYIVLTDCRQIYANRMLVSLLDILYGRKIWRGTKFGCLVVYMYITTAKLKSAKVSYLHTYIYTRMVIPYRTAKFNILAIAILGSIAQFNSRQYFRLYGTYTINDSY